MLTAAKLRGHDGSALVTALLVTLVMLGLGLALLSIVDTQARESGTERTRDRAFNLADSALHSAAFNLGRYAWPASAASAPLNTGAAPAGYAGEACGGASYGAALGAMTIAGSATGRMQPNLNASYDDASYAGATWQISVCDDDPTGAGPTVWNDALLSNMNYDANDNQRMWVRARATLDGRSRTLAGLVSVEQAPALSSKFGLISGRMNAELTNTAGTVLSAPLLGGLVTTLLQSDPLVAPDPLHTTTPPTSGITAVRCGALDGCLNGALAATGSLTLVSNLVTAGKLVQATGPTATSEASIAQLKQQAISSGTYVTSTPGAESATNPGLPECAIPAAANADTVVYIEQVGPGSQVTAGGPGDRYCLLDVATSKAYKALVIGSGRVVLRGDDTTDTAGGAANTFRGLVYGLNQQRTTLGDASPAVREVVRLDRGAHVVGGVAADGKSGQVGVYPPGLCTSLVVLGVDVGCSFAQLTSMTSILNAYNPAITADVSLMEAVKVYDTAAVIAGTYRDVAGQLH